MKRSVWIVALAGLVAAGATGCKKIEGRYGYVGDLQISRAELKDSIPAEYGRLVGIGGQPGALQLLFERADRALVIVTLNTDRDTLVNRIVVVPRP
jgi:hypothetical protein